MARTLPWLKPGASTARSSPAAARPAKRRRVGDGEADVASTLGSSRRNDHSHGAEPSPRQTPRKAVQSPHDHAGKARSALRPERTPSTSPPPGAPEVEYMRAGLGADDIYIMVEDEFYDVAKTFTAHLHQAEYVRQRQLAKGRNARHAAGASMLFRANVSNGDGDAVRAKGHKAKEKGRKKNRSAGLPSDTESSDADRFEADVEAEAEALQARPRRKKVIANADIGLQGLMASPSKANRSLMGLHGPKIRSRAAAGFKQAQASPSKPGPVGTIPKSSPPKPKWPKAAEEKEDSTTASEDEDDLDRSPSASAQRSPVSILTKPSSVQSLGRSLFSRDPVPRVKGQASSVGVSVDAKGNVSLIESSTERELPKGMSKLDGTADMGAAFDGFLRPTPLPATRFRRDKEKVATEVEDEEDSVKDRRGEKTR